MKIGVCEDYIKYGMNVFEYEHTEKQRIREEEADEVSLGQARSHRSGTTDNAIGCVLWGDGACCERIQ